MSQFKREAVVMIAMMIAIPLGMVLLGLLAALLGPFLLRHG